MLNREPLQRLSPEELAQIQGTLQRLNQVPLIYPAYSVYSFSKSTRILREFIDSTRGSLDLSIIEEALRAGNSRLYLVALPVGLFDEAICESRLPHSARRFPFVVRVCLNGHEEARQIRNRQGISIEQNIENLKHCGILEQIIN